MAIKRYYATKDTTITNAYKSNLMLRGVSGNMGQSDILEAFHIYAQQSLSSSENSRILIEFPVSGTTNEFISHDRAQGKIPESGSVNFFLKLYNARHSQPTPKAFDLVVSALSSSWQEGNGLDMENYSDEDASNWIYRTDDKVAQVATASFASDTKTDYGSKYLSFYDTDKNRYNFWFSASIGDVAPDLDGTELEVDISPGGLTTAAHYASTLQGIIDAQSAFSSTVSTNNTGITNTAAGSVTAITGNIDQVSLTTTTAGSNFTSWTTEGGDYYTDSSSSFTASFDSGYEDMDLDITPLVEQWIAGSKTNSGVGIRLSSSIEDGSTSYYTKRFFARGSQFFFRRPIIEARWDSSKKDDRGNFFLSSSLVPASSNLMNLYLYNHIRGELTDIPTVGTGDILVSIYSGSTTPSGSKLGLPFGGGILTAEDVNITGSHIETGIYSCSFAYTSSAITNVFDVWHSGGIEYHTGSSVTVKTYDSQDYNFDQKYISNITNLRAIYTTGEKVRLRLYIREKDWSPTIYSVASKAIETAVVANVYYKIKRISDNFEAVPFGTGSLNHTRLSYDKNGSYFDISMNMLDTDTVYEASFAYLINGSYVEQPERFRFRVE